MSTHQQRDDEDIDDDVENLDEDIALNSFLDTMETKNSERQVKETARRRIEDLMEERRLKKLIDDSLDEED